MTDGCGVFCFPKRISNIWRTKSFSWFNLKHQFGGPAYAKPLFLQSCLIHCYCETHDWVHWGVPKFPEYEVSQGFDVHAERNIYQVLVIDGELQKICPISLFLCLYEQCSECWSSVFHKTIFFLLIWVHFSFQALRPFISYHTFGVEALKTLDEVLCLFTLKTSQ